MSWLVTKWLVVAAAVTVCNLRPLRDQWTKRRWRRAQRLRAHAWPATEPVAGPPSRTLVLPAESWCSEDRPPGPPQRPVEVVAGPGQQLALTAAPPTAPARLRPADEELVEWPPAPVTTAMPVPRAIVRPPERAVDRHDPGGSRSRYGLRWWRRTAATAFLGGAAAIVHNPAMLQVPASPKPAPFLFTYRAPLHPLHVTRWFDPPGQPWLAGNRGVDLAGHAGQPVHASGAGVVSFAGTVARVGVVSVTSGALRTTYEPVKARVHVGERVEPGTVLGRLNLAGSHCPTQACLHWGLLRRSAAGDWVYLDPLALLGLEQVRLLPLQPPAGTALARSAAARRRL